VIVGAKLSELGIEELGTPRAGLRVTFRGDTPDADGAYEGAHVEVDLIVPPLNFANLRRLEAEEAGRQGTTLPPQAMLEYVSTMVGRALRQNYKGVPSWLIEQTIDSENALELSQKIAGISGLIQKKETLADPASPSTGMPSTAT
jgi:hypothetical protein